jgi:Condensation domain
MTRSEAGYALTCGQRWLLHLLDQTPALARPVQRVYRLRRPLHTGALLAAFRHVVSIHPALRLQLLKTEGGWRQSFPNLEATISGLAIRGQTSDTRAIYARHILAQEAEKPFDLRTHPPFLAKVIEIDGDYLLSLCLDHLAADDIASDVLELELTEAYLREKQDLPHPDSAATQALYNYIARETSQRSKESSNLEYWRNHLAGAPAGHHQSEEIEWVRGETHRWQVSGGAFKDLRQACRSHQCSIFAAVLAAQVRLLCELGRTDDLVLNVPVSNRTRAQDLAVIANLSMLLHIRFRVETGEQSGRFLRQVRDQILEAMTRRQYDYAELSKTVSADYAARGVRIHWLNGCSYLLERTARLSGGSLFEERLDDQPPESFDLPHTAFTFTCRQSDSSLHIAADWDPSSWLIHGFELAQRYFEILASLTGVNSLNAATRAES